MFEEQAKEKNEQAIVSLKELNFLMKADSSATSH